MTQLQQFFSRSLRARSVGLIVLASWLGSAIIGCTPSNPVSSNSTTTNSTPVAATDPSPTKPSVIRLGYQKGGIIPISRQRGELERELTAQSIKTEWSGPFDRCASLLQAIMGDRTDIGGCGDIPSISGIAAEQPLCIGAVQPPNPDSLQNAILVRGDSTIQKSADLVGKKVAVNKGGAGEYLLLKVLEKENIPKDKAAAPSGKHLRFSVSLRPILGDTEEKAWERARSILAKIESNRPAKSESPNSPAVVSARPQAVGSRRLLDFAQDREIFDKRLWTPIAAATGAYGNTTALVGTPEQVAESLVDYYDAGVTTLLIRGFDPLEDAIAYGRDVIPLVRAEVERRERQIVTMGG